MDNSTTHLLKQWAEEPPAKCLFRQTSFLTLLASDTNTILLSETLDIYLPNLFFCWVHEAFCEACRPQSLLCVWLALSRLCISWGTCSIDIEEVLKGGLCCCNLPKMSTSDKHFNILCTAWAWEISFSVRADLLFVLQVCMQFYSLFWVFGPKYHYQQPPTPRFLCQIQWKQTSAFQNL